MRKATLSGWLTKRYALGFHGRRYCCLVASQFIVAKDEECKSPDTVFDIDIQTKVEILNGEKSPRFVITDAKRQSMTLEATNSNEMMSWVLALRACTFQNNKMSMANFRILSVIGRGFYGKVMLVRERETKKLYAIKSVHKSKLVDNNKVHTIISERNVLTKVDHPFIVSLRFAFQTPSKFYFGLDYAPGGELFYHMQKRGVFPLDEVRLYIAEIALALHQLHQLGVVYRDLKPENILLDGDGYIKLTDFGLSKDLKNTEALTTTFCGTTEYLAPEVVMHQPYGLAVDWWTLGILCYELLYGHTPFANQNRIKMFQNICKRQPVFPHNAEPETQAFILLLLTKDPKKRPGFNDIKMQPFFNGLCFDEVLNKKIRPAFVPAVVSDEVPDNFDREFTAEAAADSFTMPVFGSLTQVSGFSYVDSDEVLGACEEEEKPARSEVTPSSPGGIEEISE